MSSTYSNSFCLSISDLLNSNKGTIKAVQKYSNSSHYVFSPSVGKRKKNGNLILRMINS